MIKGINACYKGALPELDIQKIASWGKKGKEICIRAAIDDVTQVIAIRKATSLLPIKLLWLIEMPNHNLVVDLASIIFNVEAVELLNEPNLNPAIPPGDCRSFTIDAYNILRSSGFTGDILAGCIWNLKQPSLDYLIEANVITWPNDIIVSYHRYPVDQNNTETPQNGKNRDDEWSIFKNIIGQQRKTACTEFGYHYETVKPYWFWPFYTRPAVDEATAEEECKLDYVFFEDYANDIYAILYQYTDGPNDTGIDRFGVKKIDGTYRKIEEALKI